MKKTLQTQQISFLATTRLWLCCALLVLASCETNPFSAHKVPVQQGNFLTQDMINKLRPGMTREQVHFILGTPLVIDSFNQDTWHYIYSLRAGSSEENLNRRLTVVFENNRLVEFSGNYKPTVAEDDALSVDEKNAADKSATAAEN